MNKAFEISTKTPFTEDEIRDFIHLTGLKDEAAEEKLIFLSNFGISDLKTVNTLAKIDFLKISKAGEDYRIECLKEQ